MRDKLIDEIIEYGKIAGLRGLTPGISGNISARCSDNIIITSSGSASGFLDKDDLSVINFEGLIIGGNPKPSSEKYLHIEYYRQRKDINAIFHVHSPYLTAFASAGLALNGGISPEVIYCFGEIPLAEYALPGSKELVEKTAVYFKSNDVILMKNHGVIIGAKSVKDAYLKLELVEGYAKTLICAKILGGAKILPEDEIQKIHALKQ